jgi:hypothetical protein
VTILAVMALLPTPVTVTADNEHGQRNFSAKMVSFNEVPSVSSTAEGTFRARLNHAGDELSYRLSYSGLTEPGTVTQGHIHLGQRHTNGAIMVWLCSGTSTDPTGLAPPCPAVPGGTVEGTIRAANIVQPGAQGIVAGEFDEFITALRKGSGYANVHTTNFGGGELRGQVE